MSLAATAWAWRQDVAATRKLVLLALADHADESGLCWPSERRLAERTGLTVRSVRNAVRALEAGGLLRCRRGSGTNSSRYRLLLAADTDVPDDTPNVAPQGEEADSARGGTTCPGGRHEIPDGAERDSPQGGTSFPGGRKEVPGGAESHSPGTVKEPSGNRHGTQRARKARPPAPTDRPVELPDWLPADEWRAFLEHRRKMRAPMTDIAQRRAIAALDRLRGEGHDPVAVLEQSIVNGWRGVFPTRRPAPRRGGYSRQRLDRTVDNLNDLFGETTHGQADLPAGDELSGGSLRHGAAPGAGGGVLGSARRPARRPLPRGGQGGRAR